MSDNIKKKFSGAEYRKRAKDKAEKQLSLLQKVPKLDTFFIAQRAHDLCVDLCTSENTVQESEAAYTTDNTNVGEASVSCETGIGNSNTTPSSQEAKSDKNEVETLVSLDLSDPVNWKIDEALRDRFATAGIQQNIDKEFSASLRVYPDKNRYCTKKLFFRKLTNGETVNRPWLVYSTSTGKVFCAICRIFCGTSQFATSGFNDWRNSRRIDEHEENREHRKCTSDFISRSCEKQRVDRQLMQTLNEETVYWKNVLLRVVEIIKSLCSRGLPLRGHTDTFGSPSNGNFLATLELLAKFDPFMADHIARFGNAGRGVPSYLSHTTVDELIVQIGNQLRKKIIDEIHKAKYFSIIVDSTPDISHTDQLTFVIRYVLVDGTPIERFICFLPNAGHKSENLFTVITEKLKELQIDVMDCRGQSYDNAANMSGCYTGLQARIKEVNPLATYIPCAAHSLNLVGTSSVDFCVTSTSFFGMVQELYNFFSVSTQRWSLLESKFSVKNLSVTRWSARADASKALYTSYHEISEVLLSIAEDETQKSATRSEAKNLRDKLKQLEIALMTCFWHKILERFNQTSKALQAVNIDLQSVLGLYESLHGYLINTRDQFESFLTEAQDTTLCQNNIFQYDTSRKRKRKVSFDEPKNETDFIDGKTKFRITVFLPLIDKLINELIKRKEAYQEVNTEFGFLTNLATLSDEDLKQGCLRLINIYKNDLHIELENEIIQVKHIPNIPLDPRNLLKSLKDGNLAGIFPNLEIALRLFISKAVTNCSGERSFWTLKRVKNYLRSKLVDSKLSDLALMSIESDLLKNLDATDIIEVFAANKSRKKIFS